METKFEVQKALNEIVGISSSLAFKDQYKIDSVISEVAKISQVATMDILANMQKSFDLINDTIMDVQSTIKSNQNLQNIFMIGEMSAMSKMILELSKSLEETVIAFGDKKNDFLRNVIMEIGTNSAMTHSELAEKLCSNPAALTMRMKRDPSWKKYISAYVNPSKGNSIIYVLNHSGDEMFSYFNSKDNTSAWDMLKTNYKSDFNHYHYYFINTKDLGGISNGKNRVLNPIVQFREFER